MPAPFRTWTKPTLAKPTVEDANDPVLGWGAQYTAGPTHLQGYAPWDARHTFVRATDVQTPTVAPTAATATTGGTLAAATYVYAYSFATAKSESLASVTVSQTTTGTTSTVTVTVPAIPGGAWYSRINVYRQVAGVLLRVGTTTTTTFVDTGAVVPAVAAQTSGTPTAALYEVTH